jgi:predicted aconitase with swiveling domain
MSALSGEILVQGPAAQGPALILAAPLSFWGGVDPQTGGIIDARHPDKGKSVSGTVLFVPATIGSSTASMIMLELVRSHKAPAALVLAEPDAILILGLIVAREMDWPPPMAIRLPASRFAPFAGKTVRVSVDGAIVSV